MEEQQKTYYIHGNVKTLQGKFCEVEKIMRFPKEIEIFEEI